MMEVGEAILGRRSIRRFLPDPVPREVITGIVDLARWSPSWGNTQPWEFVVADGEKCQELARLFEEEFKKGTSPRFDIETPQDFPTLYKNRYTDVGKQLLTWLGISREDKTGRNQHWLNMAKFFGAPAMVYLVIDRALSVPYACLDIGSIGTTLCYAAMQEGLGTVYLAAAMRFPDIVRRVLDIPEDKKIVIGIALGYPDPADPANTFRSERVPVEKILRFA